jgi:hypothetical protein
MNVRVRLAAALLLPTLVWAGMPVVMNVSSAADEKAAAAEKEAKPAKKAPADYRGPLPFYYAKVVSPDQKEKLYVITEKYAAEIKQLQGKLKELEAARDKELEAALTPEQLTRIKELRDEAAKTKAVKTPAKPVSKTEGEKKPAEAKTE